MSTTFSLAGVRLAAYVTKQLNNNFPDEHIVQADDVASLLPRTMERLEHCFAHIDNKYFFDGRQAVFDHLHGDQYAMFLYLLSNEAFLQGGGDRRLCAKLFLLNKQLHGIDAFYEVELPSIFLFVHPLGTVLGRGKYSDYFLVYQRCGIGSNRDIYPTLDSFVTLRPGSAVLGDAHIGRNCTIAAESLILGSDLPENSVYIGNPSNFKVRTQHEPPAIWRRPA